MIKRTVGLALATAGLALAGCVAMNGASEAQKASRELVLDLGVKPMKDVRTSTCGPEVGYAGCLAGQRGWGGLYEDELFGTRKEETARLMKEAGAWHQRMWSANAWFADRNKKDKNGRDLARPDLAFPFWKANGFKIMFTLEAWGGEKSRQEIKDFVQYIVTNDYKSVVAGFELGNESYFAKPENMVPLCKTWANVIDDIWAIWPKAPMGLPLCELFELNPDLTQVRNRMLASGELKRDGYFSAMYCNQTSAKMILELKQHGKLDKISHVIYHAYGAETPYSCSYYGIERFRNFSVAFPELKGKRFWLTEIRPRSDEDNRCQRMFRESLVMAHYSLMTISQPDVDGFNHHQLAAISGGLYQSSGRDWPVQWRDAGGDLPDYRAPYDKPHMEVGHAGVMYRILAEGIKGHPLLLHHGISTETDTTNSFYTSALVMDQVYAKRRALKEGKDVVPEVTGEVEWVAATDASRNELCLLMVNSKNTAETFKVTVPGKQFAAPTYRALTCPEKYLDCREVPGDGKPWRQVSWEDTQSGYDVVPMAMYEGMAPKSDVLTVTIEPHTVQTVTVMMRNVPKAKK